jgi:hypothetical protein
VGEEPRLSARAGPRPPRRLRSSGVGHEGVRALEARRRLNDDRRKAVATVLQQPRERGGFFFGQVGAHNLLR